MDFPIKVSQLKSTSDSKDTFDKLLKIPQQQKQKHLQKSDSKQEAIINELRQENSELQTLVEELKQRIVDLEYQLNQQNGRIIEEETINNNQIIIEQPQKQQQFSEETQEMTEEEKSLQLAFMLQQQEEMEFQDRLISMQSNVDVDELSYEQLQELQEKMGFVCRGLNEKIIAALIRKCKVQEQTNDCCTICLEDSGTPVEIQLECNHVFHQDCISEWLSREKHCPVCKRDIDFSKLQ